MNSTHNFNRHQYGKMNFCNIIEIILLLTGNLLIQLNVELD